MDLGIYRGRNYRGGTFSGGIYRGTGKLRNFLSYLILLCDEGRPSTMTLEAEFSQYLKKKYTMLCFDIKISFSPFFGKF